MTFVLRYAARSDVGLIRESNQDSVYAGPRLLALADGMGGQAAGDLASRTVITTLSELDDDDPGGDLVGALRRATTEANDQLRAMISENGSLDGMGTTLTALLFAGGRIGMVHIGDSRAYLYRDGEIAQITHDDSFVQQLVDEGRITPDEASSHPQRSLLLRALTGHDVDPGGSVREAVAGDRYLLCSDGLSSVVSAETMAEALAVPDLHEAADRLIALALRGGGPDNVSVVVADVVEGTFGDDEPVFDGAASDGRPVKKPTGNSAAGRAALARPPRPEPEPAPAPPPPRDHKGRWTLVALIVVAVLAVAGWLGWRYTQAQYFVAATDDGTVTVFRGVQGSVAGISLHSVQQQSTITLSDLEPFARHQVQDGITAAGRSDADQIVTRLSSQRLPLCPSATAPRTSTAPSSAAKAAASPKPSAKRAATAAPTPRPTPTSTPVPGEDCRVAR